MKVREKDVKVSALHIVGSQYLTKGTVIWDDATGFMDRIADTPQKIKEE